MEQNQALDKNISFKMLIKFSLPTIISMIFMSIYSSVDGVFVSRLVGTNALSSVNIVMPDSFDDYGYRNNVWFRRKCADS